MMRLFGALACFIAGWEYADKAVGLEKQYIWSADMVWLWWPYAVSFWVAAVLFAVGYWKPAR